jgi:DNA primase
VDIEQALRGWKVSALFDSVKHISAVDAAERAGIPLVRRGGGYWACCPFHGEKTPSLKFYEGDRGWNCFGCHRGGDAIRLYKDLYRVEAAEAARMLAAAFGIAVDESAPAWPLPKPKPGNRQKERAAEILYNRLWGEACDQKWKAQAALDRLHAEGKADRENQVFVAALRVRSRAEDQLSMLAGYDLNDKLALLAEGGAPGDEGRG